MHLAQPSRAHRSALLLAVAVGFSAMAAHADGTWSTFPPPPIAAGHTSAYDSARERMILFGPNDSQLWVLALSGVPSWSAPLVGGPAPPPTATLVYDSNHDQLIAFDLESITGQVWTLPLAGALSWHERPAAGSLPPQAAAAIFDATRDRVITFGGIEGGVGTAAVHALSLSGTPTWTLLASAGTPPAGRRDASVILDSSRDRLVLFGGYDPGVLADAQVLGTDQTLGTRYNDVWALSLTGSPTWSVLTPQTATLPAARTNQSAIYDPVLDRLVMYGGSGAGVDGSVWAFTFGASEVWSIIGSGGPGARFSHSSVYDEAQHRMLVFGGSSTASTVDIVTWGFDLAAQTWAPVEGPDPIPAARSGAAAAFDVARREMVVNGRASTGQSDTWWLSLAPTPAWRQPSGLISNPPTRSGATLVYDAAGDAMYLFGGTSSSSFRNDTWQLNLATPAWSAFSNTGTPNARSGHTAILDPVTRRMIVFGGTDSNGPLDEVWSLALATGVWTQWFPSGTGPTARSDARSVYDAARRRMLIFGGSDAVSTPFERNDVWALSLDGPPTWTALQPGGTPPPGRDRHVAVLDVARDRMLVFGGESPGYSNDLWALTLSPQLNWTPLATAGTTPHPRSGHVAVFDAVGQHMVMFGGYNLGNLQDAWLLSWDPAVAVSPAVATPARIGLPQPNPTRAGSRLAFSLTSAAPVRIEVYDIGGRVLQRVLDATLAAGDHTAVWDGRDAAGRAAPAGLYLVRVRIGDSTTARRLVLAR